MASALETGAGQLVSALLGGGQAQQNAQLRQQALYDQVDGGRADLDRKITQAMLERDKRRAQQGYGASLRAIDPSLTEEQAGAYGNMAVGGLIDNIGQFRQDSLRAAALKAALSDPNFTPMNANLAVLKGAPIASSEIDNGYVVTNRYGDAPTFDPTSATEARIAAEDALVRQRDASARLHNVQADAGGYNPHSGRGSGAAAAIIQALAPDGHVSYTRDNKPAREAQAVIDDARAQGEDMTGYSPVDVIKALAGNKPFVPLHNGANTMRFIEGNKAPYSVPILPTSRAPAVADAHPTAAPPPAALARLREGVVTTFGNGQRWTLHGGQPVMVP